MIHSVPTSLSNADSALTGASELEKIFEAPLPKAWAVLWDTWEATVLDVKCKMFSTFTVG